MDRIGLHLQPIWHRKWATYLWNLMNIYNLHTSALCRTSLWGDKSEFNSWLKSSCSAAIVPVFVKEPFFDYFIIIYLCCRAILSCSASINYWDSYARVVVRQCVQNNVIPMHEVDCGWLARLNWSKHLIATNAVWMMRRFSLKSIIAVSLGKQISVCLRLFCS